jgi:nucleoside-diphosphate-sugar epimerase
MRVFVAGASGAIGKRLVPLLVSRGHEVVAMTRSSRGERALREAGAAPVVADGLDRAAVSEAVVRAEPEVIVHEMTSLSPVMNLRRFDAEFATTNRLRTEGTRRLVEAAHAAGVRRLVAQSFGNWSYERVGGQVKTENDPLDPNPPASMRQTLAAIVQLESLVTGGAGIDGVDSSAGLVLRYGNLYGPGTGWSDGGAFVEMVAKRKLPIIGDGAGVWSFVHVDDAAIATVTAIERGNAGIYNISDEEPAPVSIWLPYVARALDARPPRHVPGWLGRLIVGEAGLSMFTAIRGSSNAKAKRELGWRLIYPSWRQGFESGLADTPVDVDAAATLLGRSPVTDGTARLAAK